MILSPRPRTREGKRGESLRDQEEEMSEGGGAVKASAAWCCVYLRNSSSHSEPLGSGQKISNVKAAQGLIWVSGLKRPREQGRGGSGAEIVGSRIPFLVSARALLARG